MTDPTDRWSVSLEGTTLLDRYTVDRKIGGGGMASVYLASDDQLDMPVVVKVPHTAYLAEAGFRERFERETRDLISLQHPHIVRILARGEHEGLPFLVLQFLRGGSLGDRIRKAKGEALPYAEVRPWVRDVARALDFIHEQGVVHRDIKPDNVLFDEHGHAYLSDFGIAKAVGGADTGLTVTGATPGSPAYMAPEQPRQSSLTGASDQYSLAASLYEALTGRPTHEGETAVDVLLKKQSEMPLELERLVPEVPQAVSDSIMRALERDPERRWPTCEAMVEAFRRSRSAPTPEPPSAQTPAPVAAPAPPPPTTAVPAGGTVTVGTTSTSSFATRAQWIVFALAILIAPLGFFFWDRGEEGGGGDAGIETADTATPPEDGGATPDERPAPVPEVGTVKSPSPSPRLVGTWSVDRAALERELEQLRRAGKRHPRMALQRKEIERALRGGLQLMLGGDGRFRIRVPSRDVKRGEPLSGTWRQVEDLVLFEPSTGRPTPGGKNAPEPFEGRIRDGKLVLLRRGFDLPLTKH